MYNVPSRQELRISALEAVSLLPASRGRAPKLVDGECPLEDFIFSFRWSYQFSLFKQVAFYLVLYLFVHPSGSHGGVTAVVSACTEGMAQLLLWQLLTHHKLQLTVLKYVEIGAYLSTQDCKPWWFSSCHTNSWANPAARVEMKEMARMTATALE